MLGHLLSLFLSLFLELFSSLNLSLSFLLLLFFFLHFKDSVVHFDQKMWELWVDFVYQVAEICGCLIVDSFEEHYCLEILCKVLYLSFSLELSLQDFHNCFLLGSFDLLSQVDDFFFNVNESSHIFTYFAHFCLILTDDLSTDCLDLGVTTVSYFIDKVSDCKFGTFWEDVEDLLTFDIAAVFDGSHDGEIRVSGLEFSIFILLSGWFEKNNPVLIHKIFQELLFLLFKHPSSLVFQLKHFLDLSMVVHNGEISLCSVNDHYHSLFDILKSLKTFQEIFGQLGKFICSCLTDMRLVNHQNHFDFRINI